MTFNYPDVDEENMSAGAPAPASEKPHKSRMEQAQPLKKKSFAKKQKMAMAVGALAIILMAGAGVVVYGKKPQFSALEKEMQQRAAAVATPASIPPAEPPAAEPQPAPVAHDAQGLPVQPVTASQDPALQQQGPAGQPAVVQVAPVSVPAQPMPVAVQAVGVAQTPVTTPAPVQVPVQGPTQVPAVVPTQAQAPVAAQPAQAPAYDPAKPRLVEKGVAAGLPVHVAQPSLADGTESKLRVAIEGMRNDLNRIAAESAEYSKQLVAKRAELEKLSQRIAEAKRELTDFDKKADKAQRELDRAEEKRYADALRAAREEERRKAMMERPQVASAQAGASNIPPINRPAAGVKSVAEYREAQKPQQPAPMEPVERPVVMSILSDGVVMPNGDIVEIGKRSRRLGGRLTAVMPASGQIEVEGITRNVTITR